MTLWSYAKCIVQTLKSAQALRPFKEKIGPVVKELEIRVGPYFL